MTDSTLVQRTALRLRADGNIEECYTRQTADGGGVIIGKMPRSWDEWGVWPVYPNGRTGSGTYFTRYRAALVYADGLAISSATRMLATEEA